MTAEALAKGVRFITPAPAPGHTLPSELQPSHLVCISFVAKIPACVHVSPTVNNVTEINSGGSGHPIITLPLYLISELVSMVKVYPKASHQIIIFSLGSAAQTTIQPTPSCSQNGLIKRLAEDLVSPGACSPQTESQLLSELCVFMPVLAVLLIIEIFGNKQHLLSFQLIILTCLFFCCCQGT